MITYKEYKFDELPEEFQNYALENTYCEMYEDFQDKLLNDNNVLYSEISELLFNYEVTHTEILEEAKKLTFSYWGGVL